ncbi:HDL073Wp [Eremothecium sinecaudum]|uniref:Riboflavin synthase n=1 Tax=Eremothecium sinecaudum TaxID=45286 RepID=A0A109UX24_9SACH|nr:HDL073Wp [Eremothecium sinecaudum]AMD20671.1 HDL073Wp [Eremothecium sinecaudum]
MFTGIVEHIGTVAEYKEFDTSESGGNGVSVTISDAAQILNDCHIGDSIACNGICLTVTEFDADSFKVGLSPETVNRTEVSSWNTGTKVNLERAVSGDVRFGGHYVQGHVDTTAKIVSKEKDANSLIFGFALRDRSYARFIVEKGYVAIDGVSLTITKIDSDDTFYISMIAHTQEHVAIPLKKIGDEVNIEVDVTGKMIDRQIQSHLEAQISNENSQLGKMVSRIVEAKIKELSR